MIHKILAAYDDSEHSRRAFDLALEMAQKFGAELYVLAVARPSDPPEDVETEALLESAQEHYEEAFAALKAQAALLGVSPSFEVHVGHPAEQILTKAEAGSMNLIVMGHRGKSFFQRWLLGSVSKQVMNYAHCAVMVVR